MELSVTALSRTGGRPDNQDACGFLSSEGFCFCVVADGAGGHVGGATASRIAVRRVLSWFRDSPRCDPDAMQRAILAANTDLVEEQQRDATLADMRSTVVSLVVDSRHGAAVWGHVGDSRLYLFREGALLRRTNDHSLAQKLIDTGYVTADELRGSIQRTRLYAALGGSDVPLPTVVESPFRLVDGDAFLLCTDGWWDSLDLAAIEHELAAARSADEWLRAMESRIVDLGRGGQDNYSALAVWCADGGG